MSRRHCSEGFWRRRERASVGPAANSTRWQARGPQRAQEPGAAGVAVGDGEIREEPGHAGVENGEVLPARLVAEGASEATFAPAARAGQEQIVALGDPVASGELEEERAVRSPAEASRVTMFTRTRSYGGYVGYAQIGMSGPVRQRRTVKSIKDQNEMARLRGLRWLRHVGELGGDGHSRGTSTVQFQV